jgi:hypothetical protein
MANQPADLAENIWQQRTSETIEVLMQRIDRYVEDRRECLLIGLLSEKDLPKQAIEAIESGLRYIRAMRQMDLNAAMVGADEVQLKKPEKRLDNAVDLEVRFRERRVDRERPVVPPITPRLRRIA